MKSNRRKRCKSRVWAVKAGCTCNLTFYALVTSHLMEAQILCKSPIPECQNILERNYSFGNGLFFSSSSSRLRWSHWEVISSSFWKGWVWFGQPMASQNGCYFLYQFTLQFLLIELFKGPGFFWNQEWKPDLPGFKIRAIYWILFIGQCTIAEKGALSKKRKTWHIFLQKVLFIHVTVLTWLKQVL